MFPDDSTRKSPNRDFDERGEDRETRSGRPIRPGVLAQHHLRHAGVNEDTGSDESGSQRSLKSARIVDTGANQAKWSRSAHKVFSRMPISS